jgi:hypothetical protein
MDDLQRKVPSQPNYPGPDNFRRTCEASSRSCVGFVERQILFLGKHQFIGDRECLVTDNGEALRNVLAHGIKVPDISRWLGAFCNRYGLHEQHGRILSPIISIEDVESAIMLVANAASMAAKHAVESYSVSKEEGLLERIFAILTEVYGRGSVRREVELPGRSSRTYKFDFLVNRRPRERIVADYVTPYAASINAKAAAHIDLSRLESGVEQRLIYDTGVNWQAADLAFLQTAAQLTPFDKLRSSLELPN